MIEWLEGESKGWVDRIPLDWFVGDEEKCGLTHSFFKPRKRARVSSRNAGLPKFYSAKCDVSCNGATADCDYEIPAYSKFNEGCDLGILRVHFSDIRREQPQSVEWKGVCESGYSQVPSELWVSEEIHEDIKEIEKLGDSTTRRKLIDARLGQGSFRQALDACWENRCAVMPISLRATLRASHVKAWSDCESDTERLDPQNGLLLCANLDALFDKYLISFERDGKMLISPLVSETQRKELGIPRNLRRPLTMKQEQYMAHHRLRLRSGGK